MAGTLQNRAEKHQALVSEQRQFEIKVDEFSKLLYSGPMQKQLKLALPKNFLPERLARIMLTQIRATPELMACTQPTRLGALLECAALGLMPGQLGECWIVPFKGAATLMIGYRGMAQLAWRSERISSIMSRCVFDGDEFTRDLAAERPTHVSHVDPTVGKLTHAYSIVMTTNQGVIWDPMTRLEIERIRDLSQQRKGIPWTKHFNEMAKKTVLRRLMKTAPQSPEWTRGELLEIAGDTGQPQGLEFDFDSSKDVIVDAEVIPEREDGEGPRVDG